MNLKLALVLQLVVCGGLGWLMAAPITGNVRIFVVWILLSCALIVTSIIGSELRKR